VSVFPNLDVCQNQRIQDENSLGSFFHEFQNLEDNFFFFEDLLVKCAHEQRLLDEDVIVMVQTKEK